MGMLDLSLQFSSAQAITATAQSTNFYDQLTGQSLTTTYTPSPAAVIGNYPISPGVTMQWAVDCRRYMDPSVGQMLYEFGVYYVDPGEDLSPPTVCETAGGEIAVEPHPGRLMLFHGTTWHRVERYDGDKPRITIAFDVRR